MLEKPAFKNAIKRRRCLVPADGYYEWQDAGGRKRPYFIYRRDGQPVGFAALAETWMGPNGEELDTVAHRHRAGERDLAALHHRVPVTIAPGDFERWLDCRDDDADDRDAAVDAARRTANSPGTRSRPGSTASPMTTRNCCCRSRRRSAQPEEPKPKKAAPRKAAPAPTEDDGQGILF